MYLNSKMGKAYTRMNETQKDFSAAAAACGMAKKEDYSLKTFEREGKEPISSIGVPTDGSSN